eukprot:8144326-Pyramimonas_sp.AAC.1
MEVLALLRELIDQESASCGVLLALLQLERGLIIVDSGASQAIVGRRALRLLEGRRQLQTIWSEKSAQPLRGTGGSATRWSCSGADQHHRGERVYRVRGHEAGHFSTRAGR